jgi:predicted nucleic acid-binding protein
MVADSGPILSFARAERFDLLRRIVDALIIPDAVYDDIVVRGAGKPGAEEVVQASWIRRRSVQNRTLVDQFPAKLHLGEREALVLAQELGMVLLIDEREARRAAEQHHIAYVGSLRVLEEAKQRGLLPAVKPVLDDLMAAGMFIDESLYHNFLRAQGEEESSTTSA